MKYLIVLIMCLLATVKVSFQSAFGKRFVGTFLDSAIFNTAVFASGALTFVRATEDETQRPVFAEIYKEADVYFRNGFTERVK